MVGEGGEENMVGEKGMVRREHGGGEGEVVRREHGGREGGGRGGENLARVSQLIHKGGG